MKKLLGIILLGFLTNAWAKEVIVHEKEGALVDKYTTIQAGINACPQSGTVFVYPGTYR